MAIQTIIAESMSSARTKINDNFSDLQSQVNTANDDIGALESSVSNKVDYSFKNIKVGEINIVADSKEDTVEFVGGENISITPNAVDDKVTISYAPPSTIAKSFTVSNFTKSDVNYNYTIDLGSTVSRCRFLLIFSDLQHINQIGNAFNGGSIVFDGIIESGANGVYYTGVTEPTSGSKMPVLQTVSSNYTNVSAGTSIRIYPNFSSGFSAVTISVRSVINTHGLNACTGVLRIYPF